MYRRAVLGLGYLPQETSIFRGLTVEQNIACVLELAEPDAEKRASELERLLEEFGLARLRSSPRWRFRAASGGARKSRARWRPRPRSCWTSLRRHRPAFPPTFAIW
jgi:lipopolysaccharide export system ATP-binding protein